jgi:hypothetical protein
MDAKAAAMKCARCGATDHTTSECEYSFLRTFCDKCGRACREVNADPRAPMCVVVKAQKEGEYQERKEAKAKREKERKLRDDVSDSASTVDTDTLSLAEARDARQQRLCDAILQNADKKGRLALSQDDEREARKIEKKLRDIEGLLRLEDQGKKLDKLQLEKIRQKDSLESSSVMLKIRAGAERPALAPAAPKTAQAPVAVASVSAPALAVAPSAQAQCDDGESSAKVPTKPKSVSLSRMVATIRGELGLDDSLTTAEVIAEANIQVGMPATGTLAQQADSLFHELISV